jgi:glycolate oxidase FAD binding subunit
VKNSAGFDLPKMMVGSLGRYGALVELTFKVFPRPAAYATLRVEYPDLPGALQALQRLTNMPLDLNALDIIPGPNSSDLLIRIGGLVDSFPPRLQRLTGLLGHGETIEGAAEGQLWAAAREFAWLPPENSLVKVPLTPERVPGLDSFLAAHEARRRYSVGANLAWIAWPADLDLLDRHLAALKLPGLVVLGRPGRVLLGKRAGESFNRRIKQALDPLGRWLEE